MVMVVEATGVLRQASKSISRQSGRPCKQVPHAEKEQRAEDKSWTQASNVGEANIVCLKKP